MEAREKDIQNLCNQIIEMNGEYYSNPNGVDDISCPFCYKRTETHTDFNDSMEDIKHNENCAYLIAKDLKTGF